MARRKKYHVFLTDTELKELERVVLKKQAPKTVLNRCRIIMDLDEAHDRKLTRDEICEKNRVCMTTVVNTARRFDERGIDGIISQNRNPNSNDARRRLDSEAEERIIKMVGSPVPEGHVRWSLRLLASQAEEVLGISVSKDTIDRTFKKKGYSSLNELVGSLSAGR